MLYYNFYYPSQMSEPFQPTPVNASPATSLRLPTETRHQNYNSTLLVSHPSSNPKYHHAPSSTFSSFLSSVSSSTFSSTACASTTSGSPADLGGSSSFTGSSNARSALRFGKNRSILFHVSFHSSSLAGFWLGGTRYPLLDMMRSTFLRFSGTASS